MRNLPKNGTVNSSGDLRAVRSGVSRKRTQVPLAKETQVLIAGASSGNLAVVKAALSAGAVVCAGDSWGPEAALRKAAYRGYTAIVAHLLKAGADVNVEDKEGAGAPLRRAVEGGHIETARLLIDSGADLHAGSDSIMRAAAWNGHTALVSCLIKAMGGVGPSGSVALSGAAWQGHVGVVSLLLAAGVSPRLKNTSNISCPQVRKLLMDAQKRAKPAAASAAKSAALQPMMQESLMDRLLSAAKGGRAQDLRQAIAAGANVRGRGNAALLISSYHGHAEAVKTLIGRGADVHASDQWGAEAALRNAAYFNHVDTVRVLLESGADPSAREGMLLEVMERGNINVFKMLLDAGADVHEPDLQGNPDACLCFAAEEGNEFLTRLLLQHGADPKAVDIIHVSHARVKALLKAATKN